MGADFLLQEYFERIESKPDGLFYFLLASVMFSAFRVEATINLFGWKLLAEKWPEKNNWEEKIKLIFSHRKSNVDLGSNPFQLIHRLFVIRNQWAHAKPQLVSGQYEYDSFANDSRDPFTSDMMKCITPEFAKACASAADALFFKLLDVSGVRHLDTLTHGIERGVS
ncbi:MAG: hypothetical protein IOC81_09760 [Rhodobacter sp.]|nr:hypothetical protein [Rhodobacter sp.]